MPGGATITNTATTSISGGQITLGSASTTDRADIIPAAGTTLTINNVVTVATAGNPFESIGAAGSTPVLTAANLYTGSTLLNGSGTLSVSNISASGQRRHQYRLVVHFQRRGPPLYRRGHCDAPRSELHRRPVVARSTPPARPPPPARSSSLALRQLLSGTAARRLR